jgi:endonuclease-3
MHSRAARNPSVDKRPFDVDAAIRAIRQAVASYPKAALFELAAEGYTSAFEQLVACILSIRTRDETTLDVARRLFAQARSPATIAALSTSHLEALIAGSSFHEPKARQIHEIARQALDQYGGELPCDREVLLSFHGVGPKCASLVLGIACGHPAIGVDVHVHRVPNRWGYVQTKSPERTMAALQERLPHRYWIEINALLVPFGKHICTGVRPKCSTCPVLAMCQQVGVTTHR